MATKTFTVERLFPLGDYKNIKFISTIVLEGEEVDVYPSDAVYDGLMDDVYQAYFEHSRLLALMKEAGADKDAQIEAWNNRNVEEPKDE
jgi:hypothetical protein